MEQTFASPAQSSAGVPVRCDSVQALPLLRAQLRFDPILRINRRLEHFAPKLIDTAATSAIALMIAMSFR